MVEAGILNWCQRHQLGVRSSFSGDIDRSHRHHRSMVPLATMMTSTRQTGPGASTPWGNVAGALPRRHNMLIWLSGEMRMPSAEVKAGVSSQGGSVPREGKRRVARY